MFKLKRKRRFCKKCVTKYKAEGTLLECTNCGLWKAEEAFTKERRHANCVNTRVCADCVERRPCVACGLPKEEDEFTKGEWEHAGKPNKDRGKCRDCRSYNQDTKKCSKCNNFFVSRTIIQISNGVLTTRHVYALAALNRTREKVGGNVCSASLKSRSKIFPNG